ncbi:ABC transporter substrate-binding protein [Desulfococcaceae bacterium HSG8]|nr:ABC transporter substrate-binding protein [Desulfococcaceae bacterium HSG8]
MRFKNLPLPWRIFTWTVGWLIFISALHFYLNLESGKRRVIIMGYMPVITNLAAPLLDYATREGDGIRFDALKFSSFAEMGEALRNGDIHAAFMIAPLSVVLRQQGEDVKIVYIGNRHESTLAVRKNLNVKKLSDLAGKTIAVPMRYSGHHLSILQLMEKNALADQIRIVEMNPPDMASAMTTGSLDAYYVGEPFAAQTIMSGDASVFFYVEDVWEHFICNLLIVKQSLIENDPEIVGMLVQSAARSGLWAAENTKSAAHIASRYWNQPPELIAYALATPENRIVYDRFVPDNEEMQQMADLMLHFNLIKDNDIAGLVEDRFAKEAILEGISDFESILRGL